MERLESAFHSDQRQNRLKDRPSWRPLLRISRWSQIMSGKWLEWA